MLKCIMNPPKCLMRIKSQSTPSEYTVRETEFAPGVLRDPVVRHTARAIPAVFCFFSPVSMPSMYGIFT